MYLWSPFVCFKKVLSGSLEQFRDLWDDMITVKYTLNWLLLSKPEFSTLPTHPSGWKWTWKNFSIKVDSQGGVHKCWKILFVCTISNKGLRSARVLYSWYIWWSVVNLFRTEWCQWPFKHQQEKYALPENAFLEWKNFPLQFVFWYQRQSLFVHLENDSWKMLILLALGLLCLEQSLAEDNDRDKCKHKVEYQDIRMTKVLLLKTRTRMRRKRTEAKLKQKQERRSAWEGQD